MEDEAVKVTSRSLERIISSKYAIADIIDRGPHSDREDLASHTPRVWFREGCSDAATMNQHVN